jgi:hypothetical protein
MAGEAKYRVGMASKMTGLSVTNLRPKESQSELAAIESEIAERVRIVVRGPAAKVPTMAIFMRASASARGTGSRPTPVRRDIQRARRTP